MKSGGRRRLFSILLLMAAVVLFSMKSFNGMTAWMDCVVCYIEEMGFTGLALGALIYAVLLAIPFFPGVEVGLILIALFGKQGAIVVYAATILSLTSTFLIGRHVLQDFGKKLFIKFKQTTHGSIQRRLEIIKQLPGSQALTLMFLLNCPGSALIGGGGGIALAYGASGSMSALRFSMTVAFAVTPLPLLIVLGQSIRL